MRFSWNENKNKANYEKHGIWFEEAQTIWIDQQFVEFYDPEHSKNEDRFLRFGLSSKLKVLMVVYCE